MDPLRPITKERFLFISAHHGCGPSYPHCKQISPARLPRVTGCSCHTGYSRGQKMIRIRTQRPELWQCTGGCRRCRERAPCAAAVCGRQPGHTAFGGTGGSLLSRGSSSTLSFYLARDGRADTTAAKLSWPQSQLSYKKVTILAERGTVPLLTAYFATHNKFFKRGSRCRALAFNLFFWD